MPHSIYPGTFDPFSLGHLDIATRGARIFEGLTIAVYDSPSKELMFTTAERVEMARKAVEHLPNVDVRSFTGLVIKLARAMGARVIVRGLRTGSDFEYEYEMAFMNKRLAEEIELVCLIASLEYQFVSSSRLKEVAELGGDIGGLVPPAVATALHQKLGLPV